MANKIEGKIESVDSQGNLVTSISGDQLTVAPTDDTVSVFCEGHETQGIFGADHDQPAMTLIALVGESGNLELSIVEDSAKIMLGVSVGADVLVKW
ncbi:MAG: adenosylmethionine-8-amino-7-oxononanoate aminotransferase [Lacipirellulaceae bacterium]